jgi:hypothetical protein
MRNAARGDQAFVLATGKAAGKIGTLWLTDDRHGNTLARGNVDGRDAFDFELTIENGNVDASAYKIHDFIL